MPAYCCVPRCTNRSEKGYGLFHFPKNDKTKQEWLQNINNVSWMPSTHHVVCELHFEPAKILFAGSRKELQPGSVPTLFCHCDGHTPKMHSRVSVDHIYAKIETSPSEVPLGSLQFNSSVTGTSPGVGTKRRLDGKESHCARVRRKKIRLQHSPECCIFRAPLKPTPPPPPPNPPLPKADSEEVKKLVEENARLKLQLSPLVERVELVNKIISPDQLRVLNVGHHRGVKWNTASLIEGLSLRFTCGDQGYNQLRRERPLPSVRCLRRCVQNFEFEPGILNVVFRNLEGTVPNMKTIDRDCVVVFDEMSINSRLDLGLSTGSDGACASKAMIFMVNGVARQYKQVVAYHYCGTKGNNETVAEVLVDVLHACDKVGLNVLGLVCDMGNHGILKQLGFRFEKNNIIHKVVNPANLNKMLFVIPDCVYVFKSLKEMLMGVGQFTLPEDIVVKHQLPTNIVNLSLVEWLEGEQSDSILKFAPRLKKDDIHTTHFNKMRVATATHVVSPQVGGTLLHVGRKNENHIMVTTGWFILKFQRWFKIVTSRNQSTALSYNNKEAYSRAIEIIHLIADIFEGSTFAPDWKVTQTHVLMACRSLLELQRILLQKEDSKYVCCGNFTQDSAENVFSCIRIQRPKPSALDFKFRLKQYVFGNLAVKVVNSSYAHDDPPSLLNLLATANASNPRHPSPAEESTLIFPDLRQCHNLRDEDNVILYRMSGYVIRKMKNRINCPQCMAALLHQDDVDHRHAGLTIATDINPGDQVCVSNEVFELFHDVERLLVGSLHHLPKMRRHDKQALCKHIFSSVQLRQLPTCHELKMSRLVGGFLSMRFTQLSRYLTKLCTPVSPAFSSRSMAMHVLVDTLNYSSQTNVYIH